MKKFLVFACIMLLVPTYAGAGELMERLTADGVLGDETAREEEQKKQWAEKTNHITGEDANECTKVYSGRFSYHKVPCKTNISAEQATDISEGAAKKASGHLGSEAAGAGVRTAGKAVGKVAKKAIPKPAAALIDLGGSIIGSEAGEAAADGAIKGGNHIANEALSLPSDSNKSAKPKKSVAERATDVAETIAKGAGGSIGGILGAPLGPGGSLVGSEVGSAAVGGVIKSGNYIVNKTIDWHFKRKSQKMQKELEEHQQKMLEQKSPQYDESMDWQYSEFMNTMTQAEWEKMLNDGLEEAVKNGYIERSSPEYYETREMIKNWKVGTYPSYPD